MDIRPTLLERNWRILVHAFAFGGMVCLVLAAALNPMVVERLLSSDGQLEALTKRLILTGEVLLLLSGGTLLFLAVRLKHHSMGNERVVKRLGVTGITVAVMLVFFEGILQAFNRYGQPISRQRHYFFKYDECLGWSHRPNAVCTFKGHQVRINSQGLRDDEIPYAKPAGEFRILLLGDSQLFGDGVSAEESLPSALESALSRVTAINAGVIGYGTDQQFLYFQLKGKEYQPDLTIVALNAYDLRDNTTNRVKSNYFKPWFSTTRDGQLLLQGVPVPRPDVVERTDRVLERASCLYNLVSDRLQQQMPSHISADGPSAPTIFPPSDRLGAALDVTTRILKAIAAEAAACGSKTVVIFLPYKMDFGSDPEYHRVSEQVVEEFRTAAASGSFAFLSFRQELDELDAPSLYLDTMHLNAAGNKRLAELLIARLMDLDLIPLQHCQR